MATNQTPQRYKDLATEGASGTGVFLRSGASGETLITFEQNLSYELCVERGTDFAAFKWVPVSVASYAAVVDSRCRLVGERCTDSCDADGCLCNPARGECADSSGNAQLPPGSGNLTSGITGEEYAVSEIAGSYSRR